MDIHIHDLGVGGCLIESFHEVLPGRRMTLEIDLPDERPITVEAEALYQREGYGFAVKFIGVDPEAQAALERCSAQE